MIGFHTILERQRTRVIRTAFSERGLVCAHSGTLAGRYPARRWPMESHVRTRNVRPAGSHRVNSRWPPAVSPPRDVAGTAACHSAPSSGRACGHPSERSGLARLACAIRYTVMLPDDYASVGKPALPIPARAQYRLGFLPAINRAKLRPIDSRAEPDDGGVSASEER